MFGFNKSAAMSTFATGMGIANPAATATSMVGSLVGAGIGNKVAGDKGALVGGMVNPKLSMRFNKKNNSRGDAASTRNATTTSRFNISKESLPNYAKPNWQGD